MMDLIIIVVVAFILYGFFKRRTLLKQVNVFNQLLYIEKSPEKYIDEVDKLLRKMTTEKEKHINLIQKTTGLLYAGRFNESIQILTDEVKKIPPNWQHVYYHNLILSHFFNGEIDKGNEILEEATDVLNEYAKRDSNKKAIEFIYAIADFYNGKGESRIEFFKDLTEIGRNEYRIAFGYYFLGKIYEQESKCEESVAYLEKARYYGKGSFLEQFSRDFDKL
jgi:tetratricopeptide (TPR) repeat protein